MRPVGAGTESIHITDATVSFAANGTTYTVNTPNTTVTFTTLATRATASYSSDGWLITTPPVTQRAPGVAVVKPLVEV